MSYYGSQYRLYVPPSHLDDLKVKMTITTQRTTKEMELPTKPKRIVIFGATGDLCKRKLIPALNKLWRQDLLPPQFTIIGVSRTEHSKESWLEHLGVDDEEFIQWVDYRSADLSRVDTLERLQSDEDTTYFLSVPPERYEDAIVNLKSAGLLDLSLIHI